MKLERIDLYSYFNVKRPENAKGYLNAYIINQSQEFCAKRLRPAMLVLPGGGYGFLSDRENEPIALYYLNQGFNAFVLEYSVVTPHYPYQLIEACMAIAYIRENAVKYNIDGQHICSIGFSAGGHLNSMLATLTGEEVVKEFLGEHAKNCRPDAVILSYPVITYIGPRHQGSFDNLTDKDEELSKALSTETRVDENSVPAFIWATANDMGVPCESSLYMALAYRKARVPFELHIFADGIHGLSLATKEVNTPNPAVSEWKELCNTWLKSRGFVISQND
jgi:acetyl esterase/lipase